MIVHYRLDSGSSRFTVQAFAGGLLSVFAHNPTFIVRDFRGWMEFDDQTYMEAAFELAVRADSLALLDNVKPKDRQEIETTMRREVLEIDRYPEITFRSTDVSGGPLGDHLFRVRLVGELSLHGVKGPHAVETQLRILGDEIRLSGTTALSLSAFRMKLVTALGGMIKLKEVVQLAFDLGGRKESREAERS
jgi:polyisoprenoid-binding protein YceI